MDHFPFSIQPDPKRLFVKEKKTGAGTNLIPAFNSNVVEMLGILGNVLFRNAEAPTHYEKVRYEVRDLPGIVRRLGLGTTMPIYCRDGIYRH